MTNIPDNMLAIEIVSKGNSGKFQPTQRKIPIPKATEVLVKVAAAGINRPDVMQRQGLYPPPEGASDIPGLEISGTIIKLGNQVKTLRVGDKICALVTGGGYAEYCLADERLCLAIPKGFSLIQAAAIPETFFTVWSNLFNRAGIIADETLLVHGGTSGIGTTAIQLAKNFGIRIIITAGTDEKCHFCLKLGADAAINYHTEDFVKVIKSITEEKGVNVVLDIIGGDYFPRNLKCLSEDGKLVQIAIQKGPKSEINLLPIMLKRLTVTGSTLRSRDLGFKENIADQLLKNVWPLFESGKIAPVIYKTFPLTKASKAHELMESSQHIGKIVLTIN